MQDQIHLLCAVFGPKVHSDEEEGRVDFAVQIRDKFRGIQHCMRQTHSSSTMLLSWRLTTILHTAAGASGRRSYSRRIEYCVTVIESVGRTLSPKPHIRARTGFCTTSIE